MGHFSALGASSPPNYPTPGCGLAGRTTPRSGCSSKTLPISGLRGKSRTQRGSIPVPPGLRVRSPPTLAALPSPSRPRQRPQKTPQWPKRSPVTHPTSTCSSNTARSATLSGVAAALTTAKHVNAIAIPSSKPTICTPVLHDASDVSQTTDKPRPCGKGTKCTSGVDSIPPPAVAPGAKETATDCILVLAAEEHSGVLAVDETIATYALRDITAQDIDLSRFTSQEFEEFLVEKRKAVSVSTLNSYRSALKDLYRRKQILLPPSYEKSMSTFFSGLKRLQASKYQSGSPITVFTLPGVVQGNY
ncbi:hypothetical protein ON010_g11192 [Phytophthora cinnamomi]|nr:hypothetical protein ON010_g11192 [Phytophthora cinnamomi]